MDDTGLLQLAQSLREDVGAGVGKPRTQVGEALRPEQQLTDDEQRPATVRDSIKATREEVGR